MDNKLHTHTQADQAQSSTHEMQIIIIKSYRYQEIQIMLKCEITYKNTWNKIAIKTTHLV